MKTKTSILVLILGIIVASCFPVNAVADYDRQVDFKQYKSFAFFKPGIDEAEVSDLDKKRIMRAIESEMIDKGFMRSESPDMLISIITKEKEHVNANNTWGMGGGFNNVSTRTEGILYIDIIDAASKELVWQGKGTGTLITDNMDKKQERINEFVNGILSIYPPGTNDKRKRRKKKVYDYPPYN